MVSETRDPTHVVLTSGGKRKNQVACAKNRLIDDSELASGTFKDNPINKSNLYDVITKSNNGCSVVQSMVKECNANNIDDYPNSNIPTVNVNSIVQKPIDEHVGTSFKTNYSFSTPVNSIKQEMSDSSPNCDVAYSSIFNDDIGNCEGNIERYAGTPTNENRCQGISVSDKSRSVDQASHLEERKRPSPFDSSMGDST